MTLDFEAAGLWSLEFWLLFVVLFVVLFAVGMVLLWAMNR